MNLWISLSGCKPVGQLIDGWLGAISPTIAGVASDVPQIFVYFKKMLGKLFVGEILEPHF